MNIDALISFRRLKMVLNGSLLMKDFYFLKYFAASKNNAAFMNVSISISWNIGKVSKK